MLFRSLTFVSPALYRCDHVVPHYLGVNQATAREEPNFEYVFEVVIDAEQIIFFDRPIRLVETFQRYENFSCTTFGYRLGDLPR